MGEAEPMSVANGLEAVAAAQAALRGVLDVQWVSSSAQLFAERTEELRLELLQCERAVEDIHILYGQLLAVMPRECMAQLW